MVHKLLANLAVFTVYRFFNCIIFQYNIILCEAIICNKSTLSVSLSGIWVL